VCTALIAPLPSSLHLLLPLPLLLLLLLLLCTMVT
jgi:hypothetical protein